MSPPPSPQGPKATGKYDSKDPGLRFYCALISRVQKIQRVLNQITVA